MIQTNIIEPENISFKNQETQDFYDTSCTLHKIVEIVYISTKQILPTLTDSSEVKKLYDILLKFAQEISSCVLQSEQKLGELLEASN